MAIGYVFPAMLDLARIREIVESDDAWGKPYPPMGTRRILRVMLDALAPIPSQPWDGVTERRVRERDRRERTTSAWSRSDGRYRATVVPDRRATPTAPETE